MLASNFAICQSYIVKVYKNILFQTITLPLSLYKAIKTITIKPLTQIKYTNKIHNNNEFEFRNT